VSRFDEDLRSTLRRGTPHVDVDAFLTDVHRGARRRRQRRAVGVAAAAVLVVAGAAGVLLPSSGPHSAPPVAGTSTPPTAAPSPSAARPSTSPSAARPTEVPTGDTGHPLETGVVGFAAAADGALWRVSAIGCGPVALCSQVSSYDGAGRWTTLAELPWAHPQPGEPQAPALHVTVAADGKDAWAYGGEAWSSHDAGRTWTRLQLPLQDTGAGEVAVTGATAVLRTDDGHLLRSPTGSDDWQPLSLPSGMDYSEQVLGLGETLVVRGRSPQFHLLVARSDDGGATWTVAPGPCDPEQPAFTVAQGSLFAVCPAGDGSPTSGADIMRSDDQGRSWTKALFLPPRKDDAGVQAILAVDRTSVYEVGTFGGVLRFPEGEKQYGDAVHLDQAQTVSDESRFVTPEHGYLLLGSPQVLLETTDAGQTWTPIG
jgi:photosystem II stability/assembly factor-like uncharacterized protein